MNQRTHSSPRRAAAPSQAHAAPAAPPLWQQLDAVAQCLQSVLEGQSSRSVLAGVHVHVGVPEGIDRIRTMNRVTPWLPLLLGLLAVALWQKVRDRLPYLLDPTEAPPPFR